MSSMTWSATKICFFYDTLPSIIIDEPNVMYGCSEVTSWRILFCLSVEVHYPGVLLFLSFLCSYHSSVLIILMFFSFIDAPFLFWGVFKVFGWCKTGAFRLRYDLMMTCCWSLNDDVTFGKTFGGEEEGRAVSTRPLPKCVGGAWLEAYFRRV